MSLNFDDTIEGNDWVKLASRADNEWVKLPHQTNMPKRVPIIMGAFATLGAYLLYDFNDNVFSWPLIAVYAAVVVTISLLSIRLNRFAVPHPEINLGTKEIRLGRKAVPLAEVSQADLTYENVGGYNVNLYLHHGNKKMRVLLMNFSKPNLSDSSYRVLNSALNSTSIPVKFKSEGKRQARAVTYTVGVLQAQWVINEQIENVERANEYSSSKA